MFGLCGLIPLQTHFLPVFGLMEVLYQPLWRILRRKITLFIIQQHNQSWFIKMEAEQSTICIRKAETKDLDDVIRLYRAGLVELGEPYSDSLTMNKVLISFYLAPCFLLVIDDNICGIAGLTVVTSSHNGDASLSDYMFYVLPEHRSLRTLNSLVREVKAFADEKNLPLKLEFVADFDENIRKRLFEMNGFKKCNLVGVYNG